MKQKLYIIIALLCAVAGTANTALADEGWSVEHSGSKFTITRTDASQEETVLYRTVSITAFEGKNFTPVSGSVTFRVNETQKEVTVYETAVANIPTAFKYQTIDERKYSFQVTEADGNILAQMDRIISMGNDYKINAGNAFAEQRIPIYNNEFTITDAGYSQKILYVGTDNYFISAAPKAWLTDINATLKMKVSMKAKEENDGYQYIQIYANPTSTDIDTGAENGDPGSCTYAKYVAGFELYKGGIATQYNEYTFPVTSAGNDEGATNPWGYGNNYNLIKQKFNTTGCRADDGRLIIPNDLSTLYVRFNASGSDNDNWCASNVAAHIQASDNTAPTLAAEGIVLSPGRHGMGNDFYVSVAFSEIVTYTSIPSLTTNWGDVHCIDGNGTNVLTFKGDIYDAVGTPLQITGYYGTITDLAGNPFAGEISKTFTDVVEMPFLGSGTEDDPYIIRDKPDLEYIRGLVNHVDDCSGIFFKMGRDISMGRTTEPIGESSNRPFSGTFDGDGHTISNLMVSTNGNSSGLFGYLNGTVKNLIINGAEIGESKYVGTIAGFAKNGTVTDCIVFNTIVNVVGAFFGPVVGDGSPNNCYYRNVRLGDLNNIKSNIYTVSAGEDVTMSGIPTVTYKGTAYYSRGSTITLGYTGTVPTCHHVVYSATYGTINGNVLETRGFDTNVSATIVPDESISLADNADNSAGIAALAANGQPHNIMLDGRTLYKDGYWNTLCLPFNLDAAQVTAQLAPSKLMTLSTSSFENGTLTLNFADATTIEAGKPYIIKWTSGDNLVNPVFIAVTVGNEDPDDQKVVSAGGKVQFIGTYSPETLSGNSVLYLGAENKLYYPASTKTIGAFRAYFQLNGLTAGTPASPIKEFRLNFGNDEAGADAIRTIDNGQLIIDNCWYSLDGRKLAGKSTQKGIYIHNGRKEAVK